MSNVLWLEHHGAWFPNAYVGDMASETVVSHNVMVSGLFPKHMGWSDEAFRDTTNVLGGGANGIYVTGDLSYDQFVSLVAAGDYPKLGTYLHTTFPGTTVACVGEKNYQVRSMTAGNADIGVHLSGRSSADPTLVGLLGGAYRGPDGVNVPLYISSDPANRFYINSDTSNDYSTLTTTPAWIYPEDGNRLIPGTDLGHLGGDNWVADATIKIMQNENWSGMFVNFGAIDKIGHMWGGGAVDNVKKYGWDPNSIYNQVHLPFIAKNADNQLGRLIGTLKALHEFKQTLIVVVADHGSTYGKHFYGINDQNAGDYNWYYGTSVNDGTDYNTPGRPITPALKPLIDTGNVAFTYSSTAIEAWLTDFSMPKKIAAAKVMRTRPGVIATYVKSDDGIALHPHVQGQDELRRSRVVEEARPGAREHHGVVRLGRRRRPAGRSHELRSLRRPRRRAEGRAAHPHGLLQPGSRAVRCTAGRAARRHHADRHAHDGHRADRRDGRASAYTLKTK